jgi:hypothetical protein
MQADCLGNAARFVVVDSEIVAPPQGLMVFGAQNTLAASQRLLSKPDCLTESACCPIVNS